MIYVVPEGAEIEYARYKGIDIIEFKVTRPYSYDVVCNVTSLPFQSPDVKIIDYSAFVDAMCDYFKVTVDLREKERLIYREDAGFIVKCMYNKLLDIDEDLIYVSEFLKSTLTGQKYLIIKRFEDLQDRYSLNYIYSAFINFIMGSKEIVAKYGEEGRKRMLLYLGTGVNDLEYRMLHIILSVF